MYLQWRSTSKVRFPNMALLWERLEDQEVWETTLPLLFRVAPLDPSQVHITKEDMSPLYDIPLAAPKLEATTNLSDIIHDSICNKSSI